MIALNKQSFIFHIEHCMIYVCSKCYVLFTLKKIGRDLLTIKTKKMFKRDYALINIMITLVKILITSNMN